MRIEQTDRRWFIPDVVDGTTNVWPQAKFHEFADWVTSGGINIIKWWCDNFESVTGLKYLHANEQPMVTDRKMEMTVESMSDMDREVADIGRAIANRTDQQDRFGLDVGKPVPVTMFLNDIIRHLEQKKIKIHRAADIRKGLGENAGLVATKWRMVVDQRLSLVVMNRAAEVEFLKLLSPREREGWLGNDTKDSWIRGKSGMAQEFLRERRQTPASIGMVPEL